MKKKMAKGNKVSWKYGKGKATGEIQKRADKRTSITSHGKKIIRNGRADNPAYTIKQENGTKLLKLESEIKKD